MFNPLTEPLPVTPHGLMCMLALKYLQEFEKSVHLTPCDNTELLLLRRVIRARTYDEAKRRYHIFHTFQGSKEVDVRHPSCDSCVLRAFQQKAGLGEPAHEPQAHDVPALEES
ncbi:precoat protein [Cowpea golden mosaic virus]|uniref:Protein V2 n=1 Tax=Cowpea golden mosaic virus TaxID=69263 RepID=O55375_9GEMI|nr:precoat protein [Cowpea golden mosaic virus-[Nigeria]]AAB87605.1 precoat protein [Cowpea golden mosaic virus-[Nigeria]]